MLDLDDVRTEPRQQLRRERHRRHLLEREHPHAVERLPVLRGALVGDVAYSQPNSSIAGRPTVYGLPRRTGKFCNFCLLDRRAHQKERVDRIDLAFDLDRTERFDTDRVAEELACRFADDDLTGWRERLRVATQGSRCRRWR